MDKVLLDRTLDKQKMVGWVNGIIDICDKARSIYRWMNVLYT